MNTKKYIGRFAPSPTGPLHFGSLVTAVASYFQAKTQGGKWLLRIEDIDTLREQKGASNSILKILEAHHLQWDNEVVYQSLRQDSYFHAIEQLQKLNRLFRCQCSRKTIMQQNLKQRYNSKLQTSSVYPGTCRHKIISPDKPHSLRLLAGDQTIQYTDVIQGIQTENIKHTGDFVVQKRDGSISYQLAVAIDDATQKITEVIRGVDLITSCSRQILILSLLNYPIPQYCHLPVVCHIDGSKLSKQTGAMALHESKATLQLWTALWYLSQMPPNELKTTNIEELHQWAMQNWNISKISNQHNSLLYR